MNFPQPVILSAAKDPVARPAAGNAVGFFTSFRMTNQGVHWQRSEESTLTPHAPFGFETPAGFFPFASLMVRMTDAGKTRIKGGLHWEKEFIHASCGQGSAALRCGAPEVERPRSMYERINRPRRWTISGCRSARFFFSAGSAARS
jgi:hypothetical protein